MKQMVKVKLLTFLMILGSLAIVNAQLLDLKILTFNMQQPFGTNWDGRKAGAAQIINTYQGDIIGTQELVNYQRDYIMNSCSGYTVYGQGRDCGDNGEGSWIMYKTAKFTLDAANSGNFWFSDNPNVCARGYDPNYNRICTYVRLIDKATGKAFYVFNSHFPTPDQPTARTKSATLLCAKAAARAFINDPVIFTGDFNSLETETQVNYIKSGAANPSKMRDTYRELYPTGNVTTGFGVKFDYIFTENKSNVSALATQVITSPVASDHMPLSATIRLNFGANPNPPIVVYTIPGKVEAENFSAMSGVQIENTLDVGAGTNVGWLDAGDFMEYKINATTTSAYDIAFRLASLVGGGVMKIQIDGVDVPGLINSSATGGWQTWVSLIKENVMITSGAHTIRLVVVTGGFNINYINFSTAVIPQSPFNNVVVSIPGKVEAENYDLGSQGIAYNDNTTGNQGAVYRADGVDLEATSDIDGGYNVGWTADGEWLEYTVNVVTSGNYDIAFRSASAGGGKIRMEIDGIDVTGNIDLPNTNGWQTWATTTKLNVALAAGQHVMRLAIVLGGFNLNNVKVTTAIPPGPGFLHASGKNIVNNNGNYVIKAANIGNYMVQEGYMLNLGGGYQHVIKQKIADVVGVTNRDKFYEDYRANYLVKADIDSLAKWGFNSIRLPMHYNLFTPLGQPDVFLESGFAEVDKIISWCKANNMYVILDLHAAPGGQSSGDISDYVAGQPSLWESAENRAQTVKLWRKFAERYANEQYVGGYDLINETNWTIPGNGLLATLMKEITASIRQVDNNHLLFIEGNSYANDYTGLTPKWDNNMAYSFHKYWNDVNDGSINWVLALRDAENAPIWLGEFGENSNHWIAETVSLMNKHNIGWAIWPYKKMSSISGIGSFKEPNNWSLLKDYINGGAMPSAVAAQAILDELVENVKLANTKINKGYLFALFPSANNATIPYVYTELPGKLVAANYDEGKNGYAYSDVAYQTAHFGSGGGSYSPWNNGYYLRNDGVDVQFSEAENSSTVGWVENNEWLLYTVNVKTTGYYAVKIRIAGNGGKASLSSNGVSLLNMVTLSATNGWEDFQTINFGNVKLNAGQQSLKLSINTGGFNINYLDFSLLPNQSPTVAITSPALNSTFNAPANVTINASATDLDGTISTVNFYNGTSLIGSDNTAPFTFTWTNVAEGLYSLTAKAIDNNGAEATSAAISIKVEAVLSTLIQAEAYSSMLGVQTEPTSDINGVLNVGYIDAGDWMAYNTITFPTSGNYTIDYRVASVSGGMLSSDLNAGTIQLGSMVIPATGGWQNWITVSQTVTVTAGTYNFGIFAKSGGWNINWFQITKQSSSSTRIGQSVLEESIVAEANFEFYPNPAHSSLYFNAPKELTGAKVQIFDVNGREVLSTTVEEMSIEISNLTGGLYTFLLHDNGVKISRRFVKQ